MAEIATQANCRKPRLSRAVRGKVCKTGYESIVKYRRVPHPLFNMTIDQLQSLVSDLKLSEIDAMNMLQNHGIISDNCIMLSDIANDDIERAAEFLSLEFPS